MHQRVDVLNALRSLVGLKLAVARDAAAMKTFQFGHVRPHPTGKGTVGQYALHVSCAWRIAGPLSIVTGSCDRYESPEPNDAMDEENWLGGNLQARKLSELFGGSDHETRSIVNVGSLLVVTAVDADTHGKIDLNLSDAYSLQVFPAGSQIEAWRLFIPGSTTSHFIFPEEMH
jgi:hypothetical protein